MIQILGDVHGHHNEMLRLINPAYPSFQVGDLGFAKSHTAHLDCLDSSIHKVVFGNHDDYSYLDKPHSCGNWGLHQDGHILTIRGAASIDKHLRVQNVDWWENEELTIAQGYELMDFIQNVNPKIIISHDIPNEAKAYMTRNPFKTVTNDILSGVFDVVKPDMWIFGHYHRSNEFKIGNTTFKCLAELEMFHVEL